MDPLILAGLAIGYGLTRSGGNDMPQTGAQRISKRGITSLRKRIDLIQNEILTGYTDPDIVILARTIISNACGVGRSCGPKDWSSYLQALWDWHINNVVYVLDPTGTDLFASARRTLIGDENDPPTRAGDCDCQVISFGALVMAVGFPIAQRVIQTSEDDGAEGHIYNLVGLPPDGPTGWLPCDTTEADQHPMGWEYDPNKRMLCEDYILNVP